MDEEGNEGRMNSENKPYSFFLELSDEALAMSEIEFSDILKSNLGCMGIGYWEWEGRSTVWDNNGIVLVVIDYKIDKTHDDINHLEENKKYWVWHLGKLCASIYTEAIALYRRCKEQ